MGVFDFMTEKTEDDLEYMPEPSCFVVLAVIQHPSGMYSAMFFSADYFRRHICKSGQFKIVYTLFLLRSALPYGVYIYDDSDNHCKSCVMEDCGNCPRL